MFTFPSRSEDIVVLAILDDRRELTSSSPSSSSEPPSPVIGSFADSRSVVSERASSAAHVRFLGLTCSAAALCEAGVLARRASSVQLQSVGIQLVLRGINSETLKNLLQ